jgi:hypothetical protein
LGNGGASLEDSGARLRQRSIAGVGEDVVDAYGWSAAAIDRSSSSDTTAQGACVEGDARRAGQLKP